MLKYTIVLTILLTGCATQPEGTNVTIKVQDIPDKEYQHRIDRDAKIIKANKRKIKYLKSRL